MPNCPACGTEAPDTARFCRNCGQTLTTAKAVDTPASMKHSSPADEQPVEASTVSTPSPASNNESEKEQAQTPRIPAASHKMSSTAKWLLTGIIALVLIGVVGGLLIFLSQLTPAHTTGGTPGAITSSTSIKTPTAPVVATQTGTTPATGNSTVDLTFSGAVIGQMTGSNVLTCGSDSSVAGGMQYHVAVLGTVNGQQYAMTFAVYPYTHPNTYTNLAFSFFEPVSSTSPTAQWRSSPGLGVSVTINSDGKSGTLEIGYVSSSTNATAQVSGSWKCA